MKARNESATFDETHQVWLPMLELAAHEVFETMLSCKLTKPEAPIEQQLEITSMVGLAGQLCGVMSVRCSSQAANLMASRMLGVAPDAVGPDVGDAFGEICNMIAGNFKNKITGLGDGCMLSVPTVITGSDYSLHSLADSAGIELTLLLENMPVGIVLQIHS